MAGRHRRRGSKPMTGAERRRYQRLTERMAKLRMVRTFGLLTSISLMSLMVASVARGTHAEFTSQAMSSTSFRAMPYFPSSLCTLSQQIKDEMESAARIVSQIEALCEKVEKAKDCDEAGQYLDQIHSLESQATSLFSKNAAEYQTLFQWAATDVASESTADKDALEPHTPGNTTPDWAQAYITSAQRAQAGSANLMDGIQKAVHAAEKAYQEQQTKQPSVTGEKQSGTETHPGTSNGGGSSILSGELPTNMDSSTPDNGGQTPSTHSSGDGSVPTNLGTDLETGTTRQSSHSNRDSAS